MQPQTSGEEVVKVLYILGLVLFALVAINMAFGGPAHAAPDVIDNAAAAFLWSIAFLVTVAGACLLYSVWRN